jgi:hypothetical protein
VRHRPRVALARRRNGAPVLHAMCSGPPTDSPSGWPRCHCSPGRMSPPTSSPSIISARRQAAPRAQRTRPAATTGTGVGEYRDGSGCRTSRRHEPDRGACSASSRSADSRRAPGTRASSGRSGEDRRCVALLVAGQRVGRSGTRRIASDCRGTRGVGANNASRASTRSIAPNRPRERNGLGGVKLGSTPKNAWLSQI